MIGLKLKICSAYMRLIVNPYDRFAFSRAINTPSRGLGDKFEELFYSTWDLMPFEDFKGIARSLIEHKQLTKTKEDALTTFLDIFTGLVADSRPSKVITTLIDKTHYYTHLKDSFEKDESEAKKENLKELINGVLFFEERQDATLDSFLQEVSLLQEQMNATEDSSDYVKLMTFHAAKGLEFDTVILTGLEEGILPSTHSMYNPESLEEERRLLYVGITRAKERLLLLHSKYRYTYGQITDQQPSRFLDEIPEEGVPVSDCSQWRESEFASYFDNWLSGRPPSTRTSQETMVASRLSSFADPFDDEPSTFKRKGSWQRYQQVTHKTFGRGVIEKIEEKSDATYLTIRFRAGIKKLDAQFVS